MFDLGVGLIFYMETMARIIDMFNVSHLYTNEPFVFQRLCISGVLPFVLARPRYQGCLFGEKSKA